MPLLFAVVLALAAASQDPGVRLLPPDAIEFTATVHAKRFGGSSMPGYHAIVWKGGSAARFALLEADVSDLEVLDAIERLGPRPGNNLSMDAWDKRTDPKSTAPDTAIAGPAIQVLLRLPGRSELTPLSAILEDPGGRGTQMVFGGNRANIPKWKSGCVVCLYSCPGAKVGNASYTVRDYGKDATAFRVKTESLPPDGTRIGVVLRLGSSGP